MNPLPLRNGRRIFAYACGRCHEVHVSGSYQNYDPAEVDRRRDRAVKTSKAHAARCCTCSDCGVELPRTTHGRCAPCEEKDQARTTRIHEEFDARDKARDARNAAAIAAAGGHPVTAERLREMMGDLSEECWCASWLMGCEHALWEMVEEEPGKDHRWGMGTVLAAEVDDLRRMSAEAGGWWRWDEAAGGLVFVPMAEWTTPRRAEAG